MTFISVSIAFGSGLVLRSLYNFPMKHPSSSVEDNAIRIFPNVIVCQYIDDVFLGCPWNPDGTSSCLNDNLKEMSNQ